MTTLTRTDTSEVLEALHRDRHPSLRGVEVEHDNGRVRIFGEVRSYYHKQLAQETVRRIDGVEQVDNELVVLG
jgi:osmotically-inducible protein OsmY